MSNELEPATSRTDDLTPAVEPGGREPDPPILVLTGDDDLICVDDTCLPSEVAG